MAKQTSMLESDKLPTLHKYARAYRDADNDVGLATTSRDEARKRIVAYMQKRKIKIYQHGNVSIECKESTKLKVEIADTDDKTEEE